MTTTTVNHWFDARCAKAFWSQHELPPYKELLRDTAQLLEPGVGERWLDLGCGSGQLSRILWEKSHGRVEAIVGVDVAAINQEAYVKLRSQLAPTPTPVCVRFVPHDFSRGFADWSGAQFDGAVSGLSLQYAESYSEQEGCWTEAGYDRVLGEVHRLLKPGGTFVFSVNVPEPSWSAVALHALPGAFSARKPLRYLRNSWRMWTYGNWLTRESRSGRFHYLPFETIVAKLQENGFGAIVHRLSYAGQAYLIRCRKGNRRMSKD